MSAVRVGLIGAGEISHSHLPAWRELGADLVVLSHEGAPEVTAAYGGRVVGSLEELLAACDIVDVCTPTPAHREYAEAALRAGKDVVCEKPLARTHADAVALLRAADETGSRLYPAHVVRFFPEYVAMKRAVDDGVVGDLAVLRFTRGGAFPAWAEWFADGAQSGGLVMDQMIHDLDIARWVAGEVVSVYATLAQSDEAGVATAHVVLTHASGALSHVRGIWGPPSMAFATSFHIAGNRGVLTHDSTLRTDLRLDAGQAPAGGERVPEAGFTESPYLTELREFAAAFAGGPEPRVTALDGLIAVDLALAALESIRTGASIAVETTQGVVL